MHDVNFKTMLKFLKVAACIMLTTSALAQTIRGTVRDAATKQALIGATIQIANTNRAAVADERGAFSIEQVPPDTYTLVIKFLGYETKEIQQEVVGNVTVDIDLLEGFVLTDEVVIRATRADENSPTTFLNINQATLQKQNFGHDLPVMLNFTPSLVTTSDAGAGVGYTGVRIRGSDATRINVTINGIPYNDSESQGTFWVNIPDIASSTQSIQIQRGVGTSTNGGSAFGGTINVETNTLNPDAYSEVMLGVGAFNTKRLTVKAGTGLINNVWAFEGRISKITSDGYIDRATSDLSSYYLSGGYFGKKTIIKAIAFGGGQVTYQAYYGVDSAALKNDRTLNYAGALYDGVGNISGYYDNQVDDYKQDHYQLHIAQQFANAWTANVALHYTYGRGFYEQYLQSKAFSEIGLPNVTIGDSIITSSNMIERRWLDNNFYGTTFSVQKDNEKYSLIIGGAYSTYANAKHFGEIIWAQVAQTPIRFNYYQAESEKNDFNLYSKLNYFILPSLNAFVDLQYRTVRYKTAGSDDDLSVYSVDDEFNFFNPKIGFTYSINKRDNLYTSFALTHREPNRSDYLDGEEKPTREQLQNIEMGWRRKTDYYSFEANYYWMHYNDQLALTGEINNVGYPIRANIGKSYRTGLELSGIFILHDKVTLNANATASINRNKDFAIKENGEMKKRNTAIVLSPNFIAGSQLTWMPFRKTQVSLLSKYVGNQYLDNTENENRKLNGYFTNDIRISYSLSIKGLEGIELNALINNVFNVSYESNGYVSGTTPYYFPQAGTNFLAMVSVKF
jgi:iron complex outermembrane recepter protein